MCVKNVAWNHVVWQLSWGLRHRRMQMSAWKTGRAEGGSRLSPQVTPTLVLPALYVLLSTTEDTRVGEGFISALRNNQLFRSVISGFSPAITGPRDIHKMTFFSSLV